MYIMSKHTIFYSSEHFLCLWSNFVRVNSVKRVNMVSQWAALFCSATKQSNKRSKGTAKKEMSKGCF
jgi:hypothetical protein